MTFREAFGLLMHRADDVAGGAVVWLPLDEYWVTSQQKALWADPLLVLP